MITLSDISDLNDEDRGTADLLCRILGQTFADRYVDFCRLTSGVLPLRVARPLAAHAVREFESSLRRALVGHGEPVLDGSVDQSVFQQASKCLSTLGFDRPAIDRAMKSLRPQETQRASILRILSALGFATDSAVARAWISLAQVFGKAHERSFHHLLEIDEDFRIEFQQPFQLVVREVVRALRARYTAFLLRVEELVAMSDKGHAVSLFEEEIPGAPPLQWHFFARLDGPQWLPHLVNKELLRPPSFHAISTFPFGPWPAGSYLMRMATSADYETRKKVLEALRVSADAFRPDVRAIAIEILTKLPPDESVRFSSTVTTWLDRDARYISTSGVERLVTQFAEAGYTAAALEIAAALLQLFDDAGDIATLYARNMYEYALPKLSQTLASTCGVDALLLLVVLLRRAAVITGKFVEDPCTDRTLYTLGTVGDDQFASHDVYSALVVAVRKSGELLADRNAGVMELVLEALKSAKLNICDRLALHLLSRNPAAVPALAEVWLMDLDLMEGTTDEYAALALAWYESLPPEKQAALLDAVRAIPGRYHDAWMTRRGGAVSEEEEEAFNLLTIRDAVWKWRSVLPPAFRHDVEETAKKYSESDTLRRAAEFDQSTALWRSTDFVSRPTKEVVDFIIGLAISREDEQPTLDALLHEWRVAVHQRPEKFSPITGQLGQAPATFVAALLEGLSAAAANKIEFPWEGAIALIGERVLPHDDHVKESEAHPGRIAMFRASVELLKSGLLPHVAAFDHGDVTTIRRLVLQLLERIPQEPDAAADEHRLQRDPFVTAKETCRGATIELAIWWVQWVSARGQSAHEISSAQTETPPFDDIKCALSLEIADLGHDGEVARAIVGRYLPTLYHYAPDWTREHLPRIFCAPSAELREAAWASYLLHAWPSVGLYPMMAALYEAEVSDIDSSKREDSGYRVKRLGEHLLLLYLYGAMQLSDVLLQRFLKGASDELRRHLMWAVDQHLRLDTDRFPAPARERAYGYWENRLAIASHSELRDDFESELGVIGLWTGNPSLDAAWLLDQISQMLDAGFGPSMAFNVVNWLAKNCKQDIEKSARILEQLIDRKDVGQDTLLTQREAIRCVIAEALASGRPGLRDLVNRVISVLATKGETDYLELARHFSSAPQ